jgi:hypothetical protein
VTDTVSELTSHQDSDKDGISDLDEGYTDSDGDGIVDFLDNANLSSNELQVGQQVAFVDEGLVISLGESVKKAGQGLAADAAMTKAEASLVLGVDIDDEDVNEYLTPIIDFKVKGADAGQTVNVVLPLSQPLPANAEYRKLTTDGDMVEFVAKDDPENFSGDQIWSAKRSESGACPFVGSADWEIGLVEGNDCVKLSIVDGGVNDEDGAANGVVVDPGAIVAVNAAPTINVESYFIEVEGAHVEIMASAIDIDGDALTYAWTQILGETVVLEGADTSMLTFVAPAVTETTVFEFKLTVDDGKGHTNTKVVEVTVTDNANTAPTVTASASTTSTAIGSSVTLTASATDAEGAELSYSWTQKSGTEVVIGNANSAEAAFTAPTVSSDTTVVFEVTVSDGEFSSTAEVSVTITAPAVEEKKDKDDGGFLGLSFGYVFGAILAGFAGFRRRLKNK